MNIATVVEFPDSETIFVKALKQLLSLTGETDFRVGVNKLPAGQSSPAQQVVVRSDGGTVFNRVFKEESMTALLWVAGANENTRYKKANSLALKIETLLGAVMNTTWDVADVDEITITPIVYEGDEELREITFTATLQGTLKQIDLEEEAS